MRAPLPRDSHHDMHRSRRTRQICFRSGESPSQLTHQRTGLALYLPHRSSCIIFLLLIIMMWAILLAHVAAAEDVIFLKSGDRVSGKILRMEDEQVEIDTPFAGKIKVGWNDIQRLQSTRPLSLVFHRTAEIPEGVGVRDGDRLIVSELSADGPIPFADVKAIGISDLYHRGNFNLGGNNTSGNSNTQALNVSASYTLRRDRHRLQLDGKFNRGEANGELAAQNAASTFKYDYLLTRKVYVSGQQLWENDRFQNLNVRSTTTAALGYDFYDRASRSLSVGGGPSAVYEDFSTAPSTMTPSATWFVRWYREFRGGDVTLFHNHQGFRDLGTAQATRLNADQGIRVKVYGDIALNFEYDIRFNTKPAPGRKTVDSTIVFGISYEFER